MNDLVFSPSDFVAITNQVLETAFPFVAIEGELSDFRVSKGKWVYFNLKDDNASVKFFGSVYILPGPLEDGMRLKVVARPQLHPLYGFSLTVQSIALSGEGTIKKAFDLLYSKLQGEGLFEPERKRLLPYPPSRIGLITSGESAAYADFIKIMNERWGGVEIILANTQVQGEPAVGQIVRAIEWFNEQADLPEVLVITRGGGSLDDLAVFNTEQITRAVAASRIPTLVAIGHEVDVSLAELAADQRASTPSNAAQLLVPDKKHELFMLAEQRKMLGTVLQEYVRSLQEDLSREQLLLGQSLDNIVEESRRYLREQTRILHLYNPRTILKKGYVLVREADSKKLIKTISKIKKNDTVILEFSDGTAQTSVTKVHSK